MYVYIYSLYMGGLSPPLKHSRSHSSLGSSGKPQNPRKSDFGDPPILGLGPRSPLKSDLPRALGETQRSPRSSGVQPQP